MMFNLVFWIAARGLKQIEPLLSTQSFEDVIDGVFDAPAQTRAASVYVQLPRKTSALDGEENAICVLWILPEEAGDEGRDLQQSSLVSTTHLKRSVSSKGPTTWNESPRTAVEKSSVRRQKIDSW